MENKRLGISLGVTINVGNYESLRVEVSLSGDIGNYEFSDKIEELSNEAHELLKREKSIALTKYHGG